MAVADGTTRPEDAEWSSLVLRGGLGPLKARILGVAGVLEVAYRGSTSTFEVVLSRDDSTVKDRVARFVKETVPSHAVEFKLVGGSL